MRIAILTWESLHSTAVGGVAAHTSELSAALARRGHRVHLFTRRMPSQSNHDLIDGVHYHRCAYPPHPDFVEDVNNMCHAMVERFLEVEDLVGRFDVVHAHDWLCANAMIWLKQARQHKSVLTIHSTEYGRCGNAFHNGRSARIREQERAGTYWADKLITVSRSTRDEIAWMYEVPESKVEVISNGVDWKRFDIYVDPGEEKRHYNIGPLDPTVLFCGRLVWQKGPDILIEAIGQILRDHPAAKFIFAGDGDQRGFLEGRARSLGVAHAVRFVGHTAGPALVKLFKLCDVVCVPSRNEPFGIVVLEAWSACKPVVVTESGGPKEYVDHDLNGLKIFPRVDSIVWGINAIFSDFERARWMGNNGRRTIEKRFSWNGIAARTVGTYRQLCPQSHIKPVERAIPITTPVQSNTGPGIVVAPTQGRDSNGSARLVAELMIPGHETSEDLCATLERLKILLDAYGFKTAQHDHCLKIKGNWEQVMEALAEARKEILPVHSESVHGVTPA